MHTFRMNIDYCLLFAQIYSVHLYLTLTLTFSEFFSNGASKVNYEDPKNEFLDVVLVSFK